MSSDDDITPRFHRGLTLFLALLLCSLLCVAGSGKHLGPVFAFDHPAASARAHFEHWLEVDDALSHGAEWKARTLRTVLGHTGDALGDAIDGYAEVITAQAEVLRDPAPAPTPAPAAKEPAAPSTDDTATVDTATGAAPQPDAAKPEAPKDDAAQDSGGVFGCVPARAPQLPAKDDRATLGELLARLAILQGEAGRTEEMRAATVRLERVGEHALADAIDHAYRVIAAPERRTLSSFDLERLQPGYARERLELRLAQRAQDADALVRLDDQIRERRERLTARYEKVLGLVLGPIALGLIALLAWLLLNRPELPRASATIPPAWPFEEGFAVLTRSFLYGILLAGVSGWACSKYAPAAATMVVALALPLPAIVLTQRGLLAPRGASFVRVFGFVGLSGAAWKWVLVVLALFAADQIGSSLILDLCARAGARMSWVDFVNEGLLGASGAWRVALVVSGVVWLPIAHEILCRGLLFMTMRSRMPAVSAGLWSAALFAAFQNASLPGFLSYVWSGFLYGMAVELSRSLWPSILCMALGSLVLHLV